MHRVIGVVTMTASKMVAALVIWAVALRALKDAR